MDNAGTVDVFPAMASPMSLRDRFQGALLGLWLTPTAMAFSLSNGSHGLSGRSFCDGSGRDWPGDISQLTKSTIPLGFELMRAFSLEPHQFRHQLSSVVLGCDEGGEYLPCWLACLPALLRYHDSPSRRLKWLLLHQPYLEPLAVRNGVTWSVAHEQILILGDFIEIVLGKMALGIKATPLLDYFTGLKSQCAIESKDSLDFLPDVPGDVVVSGSADFAGVLWRAVECSDGYASALQRAVHNSAVLKQGLPGPGGDDVLLTGLVAGMLCGVGALPVFWQVAGFSNQFGLIHSGISRPEVVDIAGRLFERWAGIKMAT